METECEKDPDFEWLLGHEPKQQQLLATRSELAVKVGEFLHDQIETGTLPYTVGVFGGWGSGKTTFLAMLAKQLRQHDPLRRIVYFNSWKYAGFMEIVPSLIYKILQYGIADTDENRNKAAMRVLLSLGKEYSDRFGQWANERIGVNPVGLFKDVYNVVEIAQQGKEAVRPELLKAYYGQVDQAQDALVEALNVKTGKPGRNAIVVLIDELDRCDPDEAFNVIKQMRVLFAMRQMPLVFVVCANPEPIGLAIKHHYGLESMTGDYEARRILEKFVDAYEDLSEPIPLGNLARAIWCKAEDGVLPWILAIDDANSCTSFKENVVLNATGFDTISTAIPLYSNLRVLRNSLNYVHERAESNRELLWTIWHLKILDQLEPQFRRNVRNLASDIESITNKSYQNLEEVRYAISDNNSVKRLIFKSDKGNTLFAIYRSYFWENAKNQVNVLKAATDPQSREQARLLLELLIDTHRMDFIILLSLLPFKKAKNHETLAKTTGESSLPALGQELDTGLLDQFGYLLASY